MSLLLVASFFVPLRIWSENVSEVGVPTGLILWGLLVFAASIVVWVLLVAIGSASDGVARALFWFVVAATSVGQIADTFPGGRWALILISLVIALIAYRLRDLAGFRLLTDWAVLAALLLPVGVAMTVLLNSGESHLREPGEAPATNIANPQDVVILVLDAQASMSTLDRLYGYDTDRLRQSLGEAGLTFADVPANYSLTQFSLASFFEMDYPIEGGVRLSESDRRGLFEIIRGDNQLVEILKNAGYRFIVVEPGWSAVKCNRHTDVCISGVWPDDGTSEAVRRSLIPESLPFLKHSFAASSIKAIKWIRGELNSYITNDTPDMIYLHLLIPHPPLLLDAECEYRFDDRLTGVNLNHRFLPEGLVEVRKEAYVAQVNCVERVVLELASIIGDEAILLAFGDHGPDSQRQLSIQPAEWDDRAISERFETLLMTNQQECGFQEVKSLVNVSRRLLSCLTGQPIPDVENRYFIFTTPEGPATEIEPSKLADVGFSSFGK